jgi:hypothetical protein
MTQAELELEVARTTGESRSEIRRRGFSLLVMPHRRPRIVDWDALDDARVGFFNNRQTSRRAA